MVSPNSQIWRSSGAKSLVHFKYTNIILCLLKPISVDSVEFYWLRNDTISRSVSNWTMSTLVNIVTWSRLLSIVSKGAHMLPIAFWNASYCWVAKYWDVWCAHNISCIFNIWSTTVSCTFSIVSNAMAVIMPLQCFVSFVFARAQQNSQNQFCTADSDDSGSILFSKFGFTLSDKEMKFFPNLTKCLAWMAAKLYVN